MKIFLPILFIGIVAYSQEKNISGKVSNFESNEPLAYVNIRVKNKTVGTVSNNNGLFKLLLNDKVSSKDTVVFSYIGFKTKRYLISQLNKIKEPILLQPKSMELDEVVVSSKSKYNLDFDDFDSENKVMPEGWFKWGSYKNKNGENVYGENVYGEKLDGENSVGKVVSNDKGKFGCITYRISANCVGDTIRLTGRMKYENVKGFVGLLMRVDGASRTRSLAFKSMERLRIKGTNDWKEYAIQMPFPIGAERIYVGGILGGHGIAWFDDFKITIDGKDIEIVNGAPKTSLKKYNTDKLNLAIRKSSVPLNVSNEDSLMSSLNPLIEKLSNKRIVSIGESTHGTSEFYHLREIITKRLIEEKGFDLVVLENPYDDIELFNKGLETSPLDSLMQKHLFPIYQTQEMESFLQWFKDNHVRYDVKLKGCDDSAWVFYEVLNDKIGTLNDKKLNILLTELKSNITKSTTKNLKKGHKINTSIYDNIVAIEKHLKLTDNLNDAVKEILFNGKNTYINDLNIKNNKQIQSRDKIMADRISYFAKDKMKKIIVWAHNAHISNEIIVDNEIGIMGRDLKKEFGNDYHSVGLTTLKGSYSYIDEKFINGDHSYNEKLKKADMQPVETPLWENALAINGNAFYLNLSAFKNELKTVDIIGSTRLIGYSIETKENVYQLSFSQNFDSLIFIENTNATTPLFD